MREGDRDAVLELQTALNAIYDEAAYDLTIDYTQIPPPPIFSQSDRNWMDQLLQAN